ncbi:hypothetical protein BC835DRAFT_1305905 [Cytidiella melzeri]|nr:hypothetical protein BC835DRAFT_1305905 [Cytidiella melzeri]
MFSFRPCSRLQQVKQAIQKQMGKLSAQKTHSLPVNGNLVGLTMNSDLVKLQQELGAGNIYIDSKMLTLKVYCNAPGGIVWQHFSCLVQICANCHVEYHEGTKCPDPKTEELLQFEEWTSTRDIKRCNWQDNQLRHAAFGPWLTNLTSQGFKSFVVGSRMTNYIKIPSFLGGFMRTVQGAHNAKMGSTILSAFMYEGLSVIGAYNVKLCGLPPDTEAAESDIFGPLLKIISSKTMKIWYRSQSLRHLLQSDRPSAFL